MGFAACTDNLVRGLGGISLLPASPSFRALAPTLLLVIPLGAQKVPDIQRRV